MTATDTIRAMLDERGVEWVAIGTDTCWTGADGYPMRAWETTNGTHMRVADLTPEQAIEATLGGDLQAENAELRELAEKAWKTAEKLCQAFGGPCRDDDVTIYRPCPLGERYEECVYGQIRRDMRELGVEI